MPPKSDLNATTPSPQPTLKFSLESGARLPTRAHPDDIGLDLTLKTVERVGPRLFMADSGVRVAPPTGYYVEIVPRSSLMWRGVIMPNSFGVIDPGYRGTLRVPLLFVGDPGESIEETLKATQDELTGQRLVQLVLRKIHPCQVLEVPNLGDEGTDRGEGGFGSTGSA